MHSRDVPLRVASISLIAAAFSFACSKETPAPEPPRPLNEPTTAVTETREPVVEPPAAVASSRFSESNFDLSLAPKGDYRAGEGGSAEIVLEAKGPFKVNDKYPYKFKLKEADGIKFQSDVVKQDAVKLEKKRAVMTVAFTPASVGKKELAGQFSFSVCTDDKCLIEKRDLALTIDVK
jgi:hypothetical protein